MAIFSMIGLLFCPLISLLSAAWFFVRWQNSDPEAENVPYEKKRMKISLIVFVVSLVVFGVLKLIFPFTTIYTARFCSRF